MEDNKKRKYMYIIGPMVLLIALVGITYAFFNYTRTGVSNTIKVGKISFSSNQTDTIILTNVFPISSSEATGENTNYDEVVISINGDTTYSEGIEYLITATNVSNTINNKQIPISIEVISSSGLGNTDSSYFDNRGGNDSINKVLAKDTIEENGDIMVGYIAKGATGVNGTVTIKAYLDKDKIAISDTYPSGDVTHTESSGETSSEVIDYTNGTTSEWVNGRVVLTTSEWNSLQNSSLSFKVKVEANEGIWVPLVISYNANGGIIGTSSKTLAPDATTYGELATPTAVGEYVFAGWYTAAEGGTLVTSTTSFVNGTSATILYAHWNIPICKRVTDVANLHTEICDFSNESYGCRADGYALNSMITYGNAKELGSSLEAGDAFDCKVSTTGDYTERFYYVSPYFDTNATYESSMNQTLRTTVFDDSYATLIYYSNTKNGTISNEGVAYDSEGRYHLGPVTAVTHLPTTSTWDNVTLKTTTRAILGEYGEKHNMIAAAPSFSYSGYAARLLTAQELMKKCGLTEAGYWNYGELSNCNFLFEGTRYSDTSKEIYGPWLETFYTEYTSGAWVAYSMNRALYEYETSETYGVVRPTIDVPVSALLK